MVNARDRLWDDFEQQLLREAQEYTREHEVESAEDDPGCPPTLQAEHGRRPAAPHGARDRLWDDFEQQLLREAELDERAHAPATHVRQENHYALAVREAELEGLLRSETVKNDLQQWFSAKKQLYDVHTEMEVAGNRQKSLPRTPLHSCSPAPARSAPYSERITLSTFKRPEYPSATPAPVERERTETRPSRWAGVRRAAAIAASFLALGLLPKPLVAPPTSSLASMPDHALPAVDTTDYAAPVIAAFKDDFARGRFIPPIEDARVSSPRGRRWLRNGEGEWYVDNHPGMDLANAYAATTGKPVFAPADATVLSYGKLSDAVGYRVTLDTGSHIINLLHCGPVRSLPRTVVQGQELCKVSHYEGQLGNLHVTMERKTEDGLVPEDFFCEIYAEERADIARRTLESPDISDGFTNFRSYLRVGGEQRELALPERLDAHCDTYYENEARRALARPPVGNYAFSPRPAQNAD